MKKEFKIIAIVIGIVLFLFFGMLTFIYFYNEFVISKYEDQDYSYDADVLVHTNITQPYIVYYNSGNIHYQNEEYEYAIEDYNTALEQEPPHESEACDIRINLALSIIATLPEEYAAPENIEQSIATLEEAKGYLLEEECAMDEDDGHDKEAQELKEEIDTLIQQLKQQQQSQGGEDGQEQDKPEEEEEQQQTGSQNSYEEEIKEELQQIQEDAHQEREDTMQLYDELDSNWEYNWGGTIW